MVKSTTPARACRGVTQRLVPGVAVLLAVAMAPAPSHATVRDEPQAQSPTVDGIVRAIAHRGNTVFVGGEFDEVKGPNGTFQRAGAAAFNVRTGKVKAWNPRTDGQVNDIEVRREGVYLGGSFRKVGGKTRRNLALVKAGAGRPTSWAPKANGTVNALAVRKGRLFAGGDFTRVDGTKRQRLAAFKRANGRLLGWSPKARNGQVHDLVAIGRGVIVAGEFRSLNGQARFERLALVRRSNGRTVRRFDPNTRHVVLGAHVAGGRVYAAIGGPSGGGLMAVKRSDGSTSWHKRFNGDVEAVTVLNGDLYVGGHFTRVCVDQEQSYGECVTPGESVRRRAASLAADGSVNSWNPNFARGDAGVVAFDVDGAANRLVAGGDIDGGIAVFTR